MSSPDSQEAESRQGVSALAEVLAHPAVWRGNSAAPVETVSTGFADLDARLPGKGWPRAGLTEILVSRVGVGELYVMLPALAALTRKVGARWCAWVSPPFEPYAPALASHGITLERVLVIRTEASLWAFEQALGSGSCDVVLGWVKHPYAHDIRRLQLAAERGRALGVLFRGRRAARESSNAALRLLLEPAAQGARVTLFKSRGGLRGSIELAWPMAGS